MNRGWLLLFMPFALLGCNSDKQTEPDVLNNQAAGAIFTDITTQSRLNFIHDPGVEGTYFMPESLGSGGALFDYDNDGDLDVYLINGAHHSKQDPSLKNHLFRQNPGGIFIDVTDASGLGDTGYGMGVAVGDIDNDGNNDVYVTNFGADALYRNEGNGTFMDVTKASGISNSQWSTSAIFLDYDRDGFLDLYVTNYIDYDGSVPCSDKAGRPEYCGPKNFDGVPDTLFHNNRNGTFTDVSVSSGIASVSMKGLGVLSADFNNDFYPDIYVANDGEPNLLWINQKNRTFKDVAPVLGASVNALGQPEGSMGVTAGDADNDGDLDLFMTHLHDEKNTFYRNMGNLGFIDDSLTSGLAGPSIPLTGFGAGFFDFDHDSDLDVAVVNGRIERGPVLARTASPTYWDFYAEPNLLFENVGSGRYRDISNQAGSFASDIKTSRGLAFGDIDNDGDIDMLVTNAGASVQLSRNDLKKKGHWLMIRAVDRQLKRDAIGAMITVDFRGKKLVRHLDPGHSYLCSNDPRVHFGLGDATTVDRLTIRWPDGQRESFPNIQADRIVTLMKGAGIE